MKTKSVKFLNDKTGHTTYLMNYLGRSYHKYVKDKLQEVNLSQIMFFNMLFIQKNPNVAMNVLAREFNIDKSYITRIVAKLLELQLVNKRPSERDSRSQLLTLTEKGEKTIKDVLTHLSNHEKQIKAHLEPEEYKALLSTLQKLYVKEKEKNQGLYEKAGFFE